MLYQNKEWLTREFLTKRRTMASIAVELGVPTHRISYWCGALGLSNKRTKIKYYVNEEKFSILDPVFCYFAGLVATDGYISTRKDLKTYRVMLRLKKSEDTVSLLTFLGSYFENTAPLFYYTNQIESIELRISSNRLVEELVKCAIPLTNKTFTLDFPTSLNKQCMNMYLRGTLDGDGSLNRIKDRGVRFRICTASEIFIRKYLAYLEETYSTHVCYTLNTRKYPNLEFANKNSLLFLKDIYEGFELCRLNKKFKIYDDIVRTLEKSKELQNKESVG